MGADCLGNPLNDNLGLGGHQGLTNLPEMTGAVNDAGSSPDSPWLSVALFLRHRDIGHDGNIFACLGRDVDTFLRFHLDRGVNIFPFIQKKRRRFKFHFNFHSEFIT